MDDCGRVRGELSFEEKVFVHAELTPMAKPKKPSVSTSKVGLVKAQIKTAVDSHTGKTRTRYGIYCTKASRTVVYLLFVGVERKARTSGGGGGFIGLFPYWKCQLGSGGIHTPNQGNLLILEVELDTGTHSIAVGYFTIA